MICCFDQLGVPTEEGRLNGSAMKSMYYDQSRSVPKSPANLDPGKLNTYSLYLQLAT